MRDKTERERFEKWCLTLKPLSTDKQKPLGLLGKPQRDSPMIGDNGIYIGVRHWTHEAALIREFQRYWNKQQIERLQQRMKREQV